MKTELFSQLNSVVTTGILLFEVLLVLSLIKFTIYVISPEFRKWGNKILDTRGDFFQKNLDRYVLIFVFLLSLASSVMTLVYSEYFGLVPCALCWFGRIAMYPLVIMSGFALFRKEEKFITPYILTFSVFGLLVSLYHHVLQMVALYGGDKLPCPASGGNCAELSVYGYDHITFPWMAAVLFASFIYIIFVKKYLQKHGK